MENLVMQLKKIKSDFISFEIDVDIVKLEEGNLQKVWSIYVPYLVCYENLASQNRWSDTGYGGTLDFAAENLLDKLHNAWLSYEHPDSPKPFWEGVL